ncbi:unnamed protein product, partial [marine sediment metagenome]
MGIDDTSSFTIGVNADMSKIRNTNGNWWEPVGENVQLAINDLTNGGTVWVGSDVTISSPIKPKNSVYVDFLNNIVTLAADINFTYVERCSRASIKNA